MKTSFTPGPWRIYKEWGEALTSCETFEAHMVCFGAGDLLLGSVEAYKHHDGGDGDGFRRPANFETNKANALLIAAAPDMFAELQAILDWATTEKAPLREQEIASIRAVLARAIGVEE